MFSFLTISRSSRMSSPHFVDWSIRTVVFFIIFLFLIYIVFLFIPMLPLLFLPVVISLSLLSYCIRRALELLHLCNLQYWRVSLFSFRDMVYVISRIRLGLYGATACNRCVDLVTCALALVPVGQFYSVVIRGKKVPISATSLFLWIIIRTGCLAEIWWPVCISKSMRSLWVLFYRTDAGLCIYHLFARYFLNP